VHLDFHPGNVLVEDGQITGLVDWDGLGRGDRRFAAVTLLFDLGHGAAFRPGYRAVDEEAVAPVLDLLADAPAVAVRRWWAHMGLRLVDWTIRHGYTEAEIDYYLGLTARGLDRLEAGRSIRWADLGS
jgi:aminoglycoside phosphotransferase (APT) family kinase protein